MKSRLYTEYIEPLILFQNFLNEIESINKVEDFFSHVKKGEYELKFQYLNFLGDVDNFLKNVRNDTVFIKDVLNRVKYIDKNLDYHYTIFHLNISYIVAENDQNTKDDIMNFIDRWGTLMGNIENFCNKVSNYYSKQSSPEATAAPQKPPKRLKNKDKQLIEYFHHPHREKLLEALKDKFKTEIGQSIRLILESLKQENKLIIENRQNLNFFKKLEGFFNRDIGTYDSVFVRVKDSDIKNQNGNLYLQFTAYQLLIKKLLSEIDKNNQAQ